MAIAVDCPRCGKRLHFKAELAGRKGKCPQCQKVFEVSPPGGPLAASPPQTSDQVRQQVLAGFQGTLTTPRAGIARRAGAVLVLAILLLLTLAYLGLLGGLIYGMCWLATSSFGRGLSPTIFWTAEVLAGLILLCLLKPLVERQRRALDHHPLDLNQETLFRDFLQHVCDAIDAPFPSAVQLECSTRLTASRRRGGELTLGLPLVGCLSTEQLAALIADELALLRRRSGCRVMNMIRGINRWFWQAIYGQSRFDQWLAIVAERPHFHLAKLLLPLGGAKLVVRVALFVPMFIANTVAAAVVRRSELDADRCSVRLVGRKTFAAVLERVELVEFTWEGVIAELNFLHSEQQLPDNLPQQLALRMLDMTPELCIALRETVNKPEDRPFDSRASNPERLAAIANEAEQGTFSSPLPARVLLTGYQDLGRKMSWDFYAGRFGAQLLKTGMKPVILPAA